MMIRIIGAFVAVVAFSGLTGVPRKFLIQAGTAGAAGWTVNMICMEKAALSEVMAVFISVLIVALISHVYARVYRAPVTVFLIAGILPLVPGAGMYRIAFSVMAGDSGETAWYGRQTLQIAAMIALAIFIVDSGFKLMKRPK